MPHLPTKIELHDRMANQLRYREDSDTIHLIWKGYLAALMEWGLLVPDDYHELNGHLKDIGEDERREIFTGIPGQYE